LDERRVPSCIGFFRDMLPMSEPGPSTLMTLAGTGRRLPPLLLQVRPEFSLQVHTELRPILTDGTYGAAQPLTARNALASTFGLIGAEYAPEVET
jgi:hypothetical protein